MGPAVESIQSLDGASSRFIKRRPVLDGRLSCFRKWTTCPRLQSASRSLTCHGIPDLPGFIAHIIRPIQREGILVFHQLYESIYNPAHILWRRVDRLAGFQICPYLHSKLSITENVTRCNHYKKVLSSYHQPGSRTRAI